MDLEESEGSNEAPFNPDDYIVDPEENAILPDLNEPAADPYGFYDVQPEPAGDVAMILLELGQLQDQGGGLQADPPPFQGLNVGNMQDAQNLVAQQIGNVNPLHGQHEWLALLHADRDYICSTMLGMGERTTAQWLAYSHPENQQFPQDHAFIIQLYAYMNEFVIQPPAQYPPPRHIRTDCNPNADPGTCCFYPTFGDWINAVNLNPVQRQHALWQKFSADTTLVVTDMLAEFNLRKANTGVYPEHVHQIMELWWDSRHLAGQVGVMNTTEEDLQLAAMTGLSVPTVRSYKNRMTNRRYDFVSHQMVPRGPALPIPPPPGPGGNPVQQLPPQRRGGRRRFLANPPVQGG